MGILIESAVLVYLVTLVDVVASPWGIMTHCCLAVYVDRCLYLVHTHTHTHTHTNSHTVTLGNRIAFS